MNNETLEKLKNNPHYKLSKKQLEELEKIKRKKMVSFGTPQKDNHSFKKDPILKKVQL